MPELECRRDNETLASLLEPYIGDDGWSEVIPLAAVLAGRTVHPLIRRLIDLCKYAPSPDRRISESKGAPWRLLRQCIEDEVQIAPNLLEEALEWIARRNHEISGGFRVLSKSKYREVFARVVRSAYQQSSEDLFLLGSALYCCVETERGYDDGIPVTRDSLEAVIRLLTDIDPLKQAEGALLVMNAAYHTKWPVLEHERSDPQPGVLEEFGRAVVPLLDSKEQPVQSAAAWALAWLGEADGIHPESVPNLMQRLIKLWTDANSPDLRRAAAWAIHALPTIPRETHPLGEPTSKLVSFIRDCGKKPHHADVYKAAIVTGFYLGQPWNDQELQRRIQELQQRNPFENSKFDSVLAQLNPKRTPAAKGVPTPGRGSRHTRRKE